MTAFLSSYLISDNWKYSKASTSPQLKYSTLVCITPHFSHLHHSVTFWLFLGFLQVSGISCSPSKQTSFTLNSAVHTETLLTPFYWNNCYLSVLSVSHKLNWQVVLLNKNIFQWGGVVLISNTDLCFYQTFYARNFFLT